MEGRTRSPDSDEVIDNTEPETAQMPNPVYEFEFADQFKNYGLTPGGQKCADCFVCKFPELRLIWFLVTSVASLVSESNYQQFSGNVSTTCMTNGSWYALACGPRGSELLTYPQWRARGYTAGFHERDSRIFDSYAKHFIERSKEMGVDDLTGPAYVASLAWFRARENADTLDEAEDEKAAVMIYEFCKVMRGSDIGAEVDQGPQYHEYPSGSVSYISARFLFANCVL